MAQWGRARDHDDVQSSRVLIATDLTEHAEPALVRGRAHAEAIGADWVVCHVVPDVLRHHPLAPTPSENDLSLVSNLTKRAAELVTDQVGRVLRVSPDDYRVVIETGRAEDEIVRAAEAEGASLIVIGGKPRAGTERVLGHVAERVVRYSHTSVLVARPCIPTGKVLVATDFTESSLPSVRFGAMLVAKAGVDATLLHVMQRPSIELAQLAVAFGSPTMPPTKETIDQLAQKVYGIRSYANAFPDALNRARRDHIGMITALRTSNRDDLIALTRRHLEPSPEAYIRAYQRRFGDNSGER